MGGEPAACGHTVVGVVEGEEVRGGGASGRRRVFERVGQDGASGRELLFAATTTETWNLQCHTTLSISHSLFLLKV